MADKWTQVRLVMDCSPPSSTGTIRFPRDGGAPSGKRILLEPVQGDAKARLFKVDVRGDGGTGACAAPADFRALGLTEPRPGAGQRHPLVRYRSIGLLGSLGRDAGLARSALIAVLTLLGAGLAIVTAFESDTSSTAGDITSFVAPFVLVVAAVLAALKFWDDWSSL